MSPLVQGGPVKSPVVKVHDFIYVPVVPLTCQFSQGLLDEDVRSPFIELTIGVLKVAFVDFSEKASPESSQLRCFPEHRTSVRIGGKYFFRDSILGACGDFVFRVIEVNENRVRLPKTFILVNGIHELKGLPPYERVISIHIQYNIISPTVISDPVVSVGEGVNTKAVLDDNDLIRKPWKLCVNE